MILEAVFIDRDGTIGGDCDVTYPKAFKPYPNALAAIQCLKESNIRVFAFTNQPGISRGEGIVVEFEEELLGFGFDKVYICPHSPEEQCSCRKPKPGMLLKAAEEYCLDLTKCVVIGDRWSDMLAGAAAGTTKILVMTGAGSQALGEYRSKWAEVEPDYTALDLMDAVTWLLA